MVTHLTPEEAAARLRCSKGTLANWRVKGGGPRFLKIGRKVLYAVKELEAWESKLQKSSTCDPVAT